ncbi:MAG: hypothetical protein HOC74_28470, partial [Gemmatimonadetes bacterium]|nr:hypothetical protein [Gemmatimonadota bacterium]
MMQLRVLDERQLDRIHRASLEILETIGIRLPHEEVRRRFAEAGAQVDEAAELVKIPEELVEQSLKTAGKSFTLHGRNPGQQAHFGQGERNYNSIAGEALWVDDSCTQRRYASLEDVATATRLADGLAQINLVGAMSDPHELPVSYRCVEVA